MESIERRLNEYLFHEFGPDLSEDEARISGELIKVEP
jgi:hypothetical protein